MSERHVRAARARWAFPTYRQGEPAPGHYRQVLRWDHARQCWTPKGVSWRPVIDPRQV